MPSLDVYLPYSIRMKPGKVDPKTGVRVVREQPVPDRLEFLRLQKREIIILKRDTPKMSLGQFKDMFLGDSGKFFFIDRRAFIYDKIEPSTLWNDFCSQLEGVEIPPKEYVRGFGSTAIDLFNVLRLHHCFQSQKLSGSNAENVLIEMGLRDGFPPGSIVPSVMGFKFDRFHEQVIKRSRGKVTEKAMLDMFAAPYKKSRKKTFLGMIFDQKARFAITKATALAVIAAAKELAPTMSPDVNEVFPVPRKLTSRGGDSWKVLSPEEGNII